jgi:hypothetical protein
LWNTPAAPVFAQILALSAVTGWGVASLRRVGAPQGLCWGTVLFIALFPPTGVMSIQLWKDIPFTAAVMAASILLLRFAVNPRWLNSTRAWSVLGLTLGLVALLRQNGLYISFIILPILLLVSRSTRKAVIFTLAVFLAFFLAIRGPLFSLINVQPGKVAQIQMVYVNVVSAHAQAKTPFTDEEHAFLQPIFPTWPWPYNCFRNTDLILSENHNSSYLLENSRELLKLSAELTLRNPEVTLKHFGCAGSFAYRLFTDYDIAYHQVAGLKVVPNKYGIIMESKIPALFEPMRQILDWSMTNLKITWILWRAPFWMYWLVGGCLAYCLRSRKALPLLALVPALLVELPLILISPGQIFRYVYPTYLTAILLGAYLWFCRMPAEEE